jgi:hypothetical protein
MAVLIPSGVRRRPRRWWVLPVLLLSTSRVLPAQSPDLPVLSREYQIKAVFLFNFAQFVDWPPLTFADEKSPLIIGVLGKDPFDGSLDEAVRGEKVNGRPLVIQRYSRAEEIGDCQILFISRSEAGRLGGILERLKGRSVLTVGDVDGFAQLGGIIRFVTEQNKVRFRINLQSAKAANLTISSKLLRPANVVAPGKD